jgi:uncharacterized protein
MTVDERPIQLRRCTSCGMVQEAWQDRYCTECWSEDLPLFEASGEGRLMSWVVYHTDYALDTVTAPYAVGWVELSEGPRVACTLTGELDRARAGEMLRVHIARDVAPWPGAPPMPQLVGHL